MLGMNELPNVRKHRNLEEYNSTSYMGAAFEQSWIEAPLDSIWRDRELRLANIGQGEVKYTYFSPSMGRDIQITETKPKKRLSVDEAKAQIKESGLPLSVPEASYTQEALDIIIERKKSELLRKDQMDRAKGILPAVGQFTAMFAAQVVDPINVAASFVPVVGPARYTAMMSRATTAGARALTRAKVGAIEGVVGAAIVEPFVYRATQREQADYTMYDSMLNIGLGSVMGAGLHSGFGAVGDLIRRGVRPDVATATVKPTGQTARVVADANPETREAMFKSAIAQEMEGKPTNVEAVGAFDNKLNKVFNEQSATKDTWFHGTNVEFNEFDLMKFGTNEAEGDYVGEAIFFTQDKTKAQRYANQAGGDIVKSVELDLRNPLIIKDGPPKDYYNKLDPEKYLDADEVKYMKDSGMSEFEIKEAASFELTEKQRADYAKSQGYDGLIDYDYGQAAVFDSNQIKIINPLPKTADTNQSLENTIRNDVKRGSDPEASRQADEVLARPGQTIDDELEFANESIQNLEQITGVKAAKMDEYDNAILKAEEDAKALEAAVFCRMTK